MPPRLDSSRVVTHSPGEEKSSETSEEVSPDRDSSEQDQEYVQKIKALPFLSVQQKIVAVADYINLHMTNSFMQTDRPIMPTQKMVDFDALIVSLWFNDSNPMTGVPIENFGQMDRCLKAFAAIELTASILMLTEHDQQTVMKYCQYPRPTMLEALIQENSFLALHGYFKILFNVLSNHSDTAYILRPGLLDQFYCHYRILIDFFEKKTPMTQDFSYIEKVVMRHCTSLKSTQAFIILVIRELLMIMFNQSDQFLTQLLSLFASQVKAYDDFIAILFQSLFPASFTFMEQALLDSHGVFNHELAETIQGADELHSSLITQMRERILASNPTCRNSIPSEVLLLWFLTSNTPELMSFRAGSKVYYDFIQSVMAALLNQLDYLQIKHSRIGVDAKKMHRWLLEHPDFESVLVHFQQLQLVLESMVFECFKPLVEYSIRFSGDQLLARLRLSRIKRIEQMRALHLDLTLDEMIQSYPSCRALYFEFSNQLQGRDLRAEVIVLRNLISELEKSDCISEVMKTFYENMMKSASVLVRAQAEQMMIGVLSYLAERPRLLRLYFFDLWVLALQCKHPLFILKTFNVKTSFAPWSSNNQKIESLSMIFMSNATSEGGFIPSLSLCFSPSMTSPPASLLQLYRGLSSGFTEEVKQLVQSDWLQKVYLKKSRGRPARDVVTMDILLELFQMYQLRYRDIRSKIKSTDSDDIKQKCSVEIQELLGDIRVLGELVLVLFSTFVSYEAAMTQMLPLNQSLTPLLLQLMFFCIEPMQSLMESCAARYKEDFSLKKDVAPCWSDFELSPRSLLLLTQFLIQDQGILFSRKMMVFSDDLEKSDLAFRSLTFTLLYLIHLSSQITADQLRTGLELRTIDTLLQLSIRYTQGLFYYSKDPNNIAVENLAEFLKVMNPAIMHKTGGKINFEELKLRAPEPFKIIRMSDKDLLKLFATDPIPKETKKTAKKKKPQAAKKMNQPVNQVVLIEPEKTVGMPEEEVLSEKSQELESVESFDDLVPRVFKDSGLVSLSPSIQATGSCTESPCEVQVVISAQEELLEYLLKECHSFLIKTQELVNRSKSINNPALQTVILKAREQVQSWQKHILTILKIDSKDLVDQDPEIAQLQDPSMNPLLFWKRDLAEFNAKLYGKTQNFLNRQPQAQDPCAAVILAQEISAHFDHEQGLSGLFYQPLTTYFKDCESAVLLKIAQFLQSHGVYFWVKGSRLLLDVNSDDWDILCFSEGLDIQRVYQLLLQAIQGTGESFGLHQKIIGSDYEGLNYLTKKILLETQDLLLDLTIYGKITVSQALQKMNRYWLNVASAYYDLQRQCLVLLPEIGNKVFFSSPCLAVNREASWTLRQLIEQEGFLKLFIRMRIKAYATHIVFDLSPLVQEIDQFLGHSSLWTSADRDTIQKAVSYALMHFWKYPAESLKYLLNTGLLRELMTPRLREHLSECQETFDRIYHPLRPFLSLGQARIYQTQMTFTLFFSPLLNIQDKDQRDLLLADVFHVLHLLFLQRPHHLFLLSMPSAPGDRDSIFKFLSGFLKIEFNSDLDRLLPVCLLKGLNQNYFRSVFLKQGIDFLFLHCSHYLSSTQQGLIAYSYHCVSLVLALQSALGFLGNSFKAALQAPEPARTYSIATVLSPGAQSQHAVQSESSEQSPQAPS